MQGANYLCRSMDLSALIYGVSSCGFFPARAFVPAFATSLLMRFGNDLPLLRHLPVVAHTPDAPTWFTHGATLSVLGLLAVLEIIATKSDDVEEVLDLVTRTLKPAMAVFCCLGVLSVHDRQALESVIAPTLQAGLLDSLWIVGAGGLVHYLTGLRADLRLLLRAADEDDDFGVRQALSWIEDAWTTFGMLMAIFYPIVMLCLLALVLGALRAIRWLLERREQRRMGACTACAGALYRCALECPACGHANTQPTGVGFFGQALDTPAPDREALRLRLAEKKRCPRCATRLPQRRPRQQCQGCGHDPFADAAFRQTYVDGIGRRQWSVLGLGFLCSLVPVIGLIPGLILVRQRLTSPLGRYLPVGRRFLARWALRLVFVLLLTIDWIPVLSGIVVPIIGWLSFHVYRRAFIALSQDAPPAPGP